MGAPLARRPAEVEEFLSNVSLARRVMIETVDAAIREAAVDLPTGRQGRMLGYGPVHYRYATGREGDTFAVSMMNGAQALSIYELGEENGRYLADVRGPRLGRVSVGESCSRLKRLEHLDLVSSAISSRHPLRSGVPERSANRRASERASARGSARGEVCADDAQPVVQRASSRRERYSRSHIGAGYVAGALTPPESHSGLRKK